MPRLPVRAVVSILSLIAIVLLAAYSFADPGAGQTAASTKTPADKPYAIEYYYKAKWGHAEEFIALFRKNHYPVLKKEMESGRILRIIAVTPRYHTTEDGRWDFRTTLVFKNAQVANDDSDSSAIIKQLFPDQETYKREEQHRFEILEAHWDLPIKDYDLDAH